MSNQRRYRNRGLVDELRTQLTFLETSAKAFDEGAVDEALRLATTIRTLVHDTNNSHSILQQYKVKDRLRYLDTMGETSQRNLIAQFGVVTMRIDSEGIQYTPRLSHDSSTPSYDFPRWWTRVVVLDGFRVTSSRKEIILGLVNKLGGAHLDPTAVEKLNGLRTGESVGFAFGRMDFQRSHL